MRLTGQPALKARLAESSKRYRFLARRSSGHTHAFEIGAKCTTRDKGRRRRPFAIYWKTYLSLALC